MHVRTALAVVLAALVVVAPASAAATRAATSAPTASGTAPSAAAVAPKVVIVVGAVESATSGYRTRADAIYAEAIKWTPNVVKVYSPNATWAVVKAAAQGANIFVYLGHGYGWPSKYSTALRPDVQDGMGLNKELNNGDSNKKYWGEQYVGSEIRLAPNAVVFLNGLCYAPGAGEPGMADPTVAVAKQRVDNFASGFIRAGARAVIADDYNGVPTAVRLILTTHQSILSVWRSMWGYHGNEIPWAPTRNPAFLAVMDPQTWTSGFQRSIVTDASLQTDDVLAGVGKAMTGTDPSTLAAPGAASVATAGLPVYTDATLGTASGEALAAGTKLRVDSLGDGVAEVHTFDGSVSGWVSATGLVPRDSVGPQLWSTTGPTTVSPNFDGNVDRLALWHRLSETATWTATVTDADGNVVRTQAGTSDMPPPSWDGLVDGNPAPAGTYHWTLHATDGWGNPALDASGAVTVVEEPIPTTAVLGFKSLNGTYTRATTLGFELDFATDVTDLTASDIARAGTATSCVVNAPTGAGTAWYVTVSGCSAGTVLLTLAAGSVLDASLVAGPPVSVAAPYVKIDRSHPTEAAPVARLQSGISLAGSALPVTVSWTATDGGSGVASYDVARSVDGGSFSVIATKVTSTSLAQTLWTSHTYRYEARARDRAGNVSGWVAGPTLRPTLVQQTSSTVTWAGSWTTVAATAYSGGSARTASTAGATATLAFTGRAFSIVVSRDPAYGQVKVYLDGTYLATLDTAAASHLDRTVAYVRGVGWGSHTVKLVVVGTAGRPQVVVDAFEVIR